jgi:FMN phosphatase YigB (HAD superfamily)
LRALALLRERVPAALVTDGSVTGQRRKPAALGLADAFDAVVFSDRAGRARREPHRHRSAARWPGWGCRPRTS